MEPGTGEIGFDNSLFLNHYTYTAIPYTNTAIPRKREKKKKVVLAADCSAIKPPPGSNLFPNPTIKTHRQYAFCIRSDHPSQPPSPSHPESFCSVGRTWVSSLAREKLPQVLILKSTIFVLVVSSWFRIEGFRLFVTKRTIKWLSFGLDGSLLMIFY